MKRFLLVAVVILCGCAEPPLTYWVKPGGNQQLFNQTMARCRMQLAMVPPSSREGLNMNTAGGIISSAGRDLQDASNQTAFINDCLVADGWTVQQPKILVPSDTEPMVACLKPSTKIGDTVKHPSGQRVVVRSLLGPSSKCKDETFPTLAIVDLR